MCVCQQSEQQQHHHHKHEKMKERKDEKDKWRGGVNKLEEICVGKVGGCAPGDGAAEGADAHVDVADVALEQVAALEGLAAARLRARKDGLAVHLVHVEQQPVLAAELAPARRAHARQPARHAPRHRPRRLCGPTVIRAHLPPLSLSNLILFCVLCFDFSEKEMRFPSFCFKHSKKSSQTLKNTHTNKKHLSFLLKIPTSIAYTTTPIPSHLIAILSSSLSFFRCGFFSRPPISLCSLFFFFLFSLSLLKKQTEGTCSHFLPFPRPSSFHNN